MSSVEINTRVSLEQLRAVTVDGQVYRAYAHAIAAGESWLVLVPIHLIDGDLTTVVDRCPVPWNEVFALIDQDSNDACAICGRMRARFGSLYRAFAGEPWDMDLVDIGTERQVTRLLHPSGIRIGVV